MKTILYALIFLLFTACSDGPDSAPELSPNPENTNPQTGTPTKSKAKLKISPESIHFGVLDLPANSTLPVLLENTGETPAENFFLTNLRIPFSVSSTTCAKKIEPNQSCVVHLTFQSDQVINATGVVGLTYFDGTEQISKTLTATASTTNGKFNSAKGFDLSVNTIELTGAGELLVGGGFTTFSDHSAGRLIKFKPDFQLDSLPVETGFNADVFSIKTLTNGKIYVAGKFTSFNGAAVSRLLRLNVDGTVDTGFNPGVSFDGPVHVLAVDKNDKLLVGGEFTGLFARLNEDGSFDSSLNQGAGFVGNSVNAIGIDSTDKIILGGDYNSYDGAAVQNLIRLDSTGLRDSGFDTGTATNAPILALLMESNDGMYLGGEFTIYKGATANRIVRLTSNGNKEPLFNFGSAFNATVRTLTSVDADINQLYVGGDFTRYKGTSLNSIALLDSMGNIDGSFVTGSGFTDSVKTIKKLPDNSILVGGNFKTYNNKGVNHLARINSAGILISTFSESAQANKKVTSSLPLADGSVLLVGSFSRYADTSASKIVRLDRHGVVDTSFSTGSGFDSQVNALMSSPFDNSKLILGGQFSQYNSQAANKVIQLNFDGSVDTSFVIGASFDASVNTVLGANGMLLCGGQFTTYKGSTANGLAKITSNGDLDPTFTIGTGFNGIVWALAETVNHQIYAAGDFSAYNGVAASNIVRLLPDGSIDPSFVIGTGFDLPVWTLIVDTNGNIYAGGDFTTYNGNAAVGIVKIKADGTVDSTFDSGTGFDGSVNSLTMDKSGSLYAVGTFTDYKWVSQKYIAKLSSSGAIDTTFNSGSGFNNAVSTVKIAEDGSDDLYLGGDFSSYNGVTTDSFVRISHDGLLE